MRRRASYQVLSGLFLLLAAANIMQLAEVVLGEHPDPPSLIVLHALTGTLAGIAAVGLWRARRWSVAAALIWGMLTSGMLVALGPLLDTPPAERADLWLAAAGVGSFTLAVSWYLLRTSRTKK